MLGAGEVETPLCSAVEETSPDSIVLGIHTPYSGYCETGDDRVQVEETEKVNREFRGEPCDDIHCGGEGVQVDETGFVVD